LQRGILILALLSCLVAWLHPGAVVAQSGGSTVRQIVVEGAQRIEPGTVKSYLLIREGDPFDTGRIDRSLKSLFSTGLFADVNLRRQGTTLVVNVVENPVINRIAFEGNKRRDDKELEAEIQLRPRIIFTRTKVQNDVKRILTIYRQSGRFAATVEPKIIQLPQNRVDLVFEINEGDPSTIESIRIVGNKIFSDSKLRDVIRTKETAWYNFFSSDDTYDPDRMNLDRELLRRFYLSNGYADFTVSSAIAELTPDQKKFFMTYTVNEGKRYRFGKLDVAIHQVRGLESSSLQGAVAVKEGDWYDSTKLEQSTADMTADIGTRGYAFAEVRPRVNRNRDKQTIDVTFEVSEGPRVFVERIEITGNLRTLDNVIRREFRIVEGDAFNTAKLNRSRQRIQNLDFFEKVNVSQIPGSATDKTVLKADVAERSTGSLSLGIGFSTQNGAVLDAGVRERNLLGKGQDLRVNATLAQRKSQINLSFTEPYFLNREVSAGFDVFRISRDLQDTSSHDVNEIGTTLRAGYPITERLNQRWSYKINQTKTTNVAAGASALIKSQEGNHLLSQVTHFLSYDQRDSRINPTEGYLLTMTNDLAGFGGSSRFTRNDFAGKYYYPLNREWTLSLRLGGGYIVSLGKDVRHSERFFLGGESVRGFATSGLGPRDVISNDALGGEWQYKGGGEVTFPFPAFPKELGVKARFFSDFGSSGKVTNDNSVAVNDTGSIRVSIGTGITWTSPFGLIGMDFGLPLVKEGFDIEEVFRLNFGTQF
jgi:outer membrane protein insertion porin family